MMSIEEERPFSDLTVRLIFVLTLVVGVVAATLSQTLPLPTVLWFFSEAGPVERLSHWLWVALALLCLALPWIRSGQMRVGSGAAGAFLALFAAAREANFHLEFTGYSVLKIPYYYRAEHAGPVRLIVMVVMATAIVALVVVVHRLWKTALRDPRRFAPWKPLALLAIALLPVSKSFDRSPDLLDKTFGFVMEPRVRELFRSIEESYEMMIPIIIIVALLRFDAHRRGDRTDDLPPARTSQPPNASS